MRRRYRYSLERAKEDLQYAIFLQQARYRALKKYYKQYSCLLRVVECFHILKAKTVVILLQLLVKINEYLEKKKRR